MAELQVRLKEFEKKNQNQFQHKLARLTIFSFISKIKKLYAVIIHACIKITYLALILERQRILYLQSLCGKSSRNI